MTAFRILVVENSVTHVVHFGRHFSGVPGMNTIVSSGSRHENQRIVYALSDVVVG